MRLLFELDTRDYDSTGTIFVRPSVRGVIIQDGKVGMDHGLKYDYYKFPGGMEPGAGPWANRPTDAGTGSPGFGAADPGGLFP